MVRQHQKQRIKATKITLNCSICNRDTICDDTSIKVICSICCSHYGRDVMAVKKEEKVSTGFPSGWMFYKTFVHSDGRVFEKGVENLSLKGTLPPTVIVKKQKLSKFEKEQKRIEKEKKLADKYKRKMKKLKKHDTGK